MTNRTNDFLLSARPESPNHIARFDPALIKPIGRSRAWFEELATGRARSLQALAKRDGVTGAMFGASSLSPS
jgi:hypothetical protein